jgi:hypothetical protein
LKADEEIPAVDARIAECKVALGDSESALALVDGLLARLRSSNGVARVEALLQRVRAHALLLRGEIDGARDALTASLAAARARHDLFETLLTSLSLIELSRREGRVEAPSELIDESNALLGQLKVRVVSTLPETAETATP